MMAGAAQGYSAHVSAVGTKHRSSSNTGSGGGGVGEAAPYSPSASGREGDWASVGSRPGSDSGEREAGQSNGQEMSFDELLALSIAVSTVQCDTLL